MNIIQAVLCRLGIHHWTDESEGLSPAFRFRSTCCNMKRTLTPKESDWQYLDSTPAPPHNPESDLQIGAAHHYVLDPRWWRPHMRHQYWTMCAYVGHGDRHDFPTCEGSRFCSSHHRHIEVLKDMPGSRSEARP